jgi:hypothetical protein
MEHNGRAITRILFCGRRQKLVQLWAQCTRQEPNLLTSKTTISTVLYSFAGRDTITQSPLSDSAARTTKCSLMNSREDWRCMHAFRKMTGSFVSCSHYSLIAIDELEDAVYLARDFVTKSYFLGQIR